MRPAWGDKTLLLVKNNYTDISYSAGLVFCLFGIFGKETLLLELIIG